MLDGNRYYSEFPEEREPTGCPPVIGTQVLARLRTIEQEISRFIGADGAASIAPLSAEEAEDIVRGSPPNSGKP